MVKVQERAHTLWHWLAFLSLTIISISAEHNVVQINRERVGVWFDYSIRYYDHEAENAYSKQDLRTMIEVVSRRFGRIAIDTAPTVDKLPPEPTAHSRIWVPSAAAMHNKENPSSPVEVILTFEAAKIIKTVETLSFDVAKYMADSANDISPGTVKTMMMFSGFSIFSLFYNNVKETVLQLKEAREKINTKSSTNSTSTHNYDLGMFLDLKDCGHFQGPLAQKMKDVLPHIDMVAFLLRPNYHHMSLKPDVIYKMFSTKFEECERKLKMEKLQIKVLPVVLWMSKKGASNKNFIQFWELMNNWAEKNQKEVIMYEAFDTPHGRLISDQGWWRLKDKSAHVITSDMFVEKIKDVNLTSSGKLEYSTEDNSEDEENDGTSSYASKSSSSLNAANVYPTAPNSIYILLVLLCVICTLLVAVIVGLVWGFHTIVLRRNDYTFHGSRHNPADRYPSRHRQPSSSMEEDGASMNGAVLEIRDTAPIVAVTYKK